LRAVALQGLAQRFGTRLRVFAARHSGCVPAYEQALASGSVGLLRRKANSNLASRPAGARGSGSISSPAASFRALSRQAAGAVGSCSPALAKTAPEIERGAGAGIRCFNIESEFELQQVSQIAGGSANARRYPASEPDSMPARTRISRPASNSSKFGRRDAQAAS